MSSAPLHITVRRDGVVVWQGLAAAEAVPGLMALMRGAGVAEPVERTTPLARAGLTPRELQVLTLIASGYSNRQIVEATHLSINSVKSYVRSAYRKIGVTSRPRAILWGIGQGLSARAPSTTEPDDDEPAEHSA